MEYFLEVNGIIFIVDAADEGNLSEAREELKKLLTRDDLAKAPVAVLGNKIDLEGALSEEELRQRLDLGETTGKGNVKLQEGVRPIEVFMWYVPWVRFGANSQFNLDEARV
jgi:GTP-binding protein SAR1